MTIPDIAILDALPEPSEYYRWQEFRVPGGAGAHDTTVKCMKQEDGSYVWESVANSGDNDHTHAEYALVDHTHDPVTQAKARMSLATTTLTSASVDVTTELTVGAGETWVSEWTYRIKSAPGGIKFGVHITNIQEGFCTILGSDASAADVRGETQLSLGSLHAQPFARLATDWAQVHLAATIVGGVSSGYARFMFAAAVGGEEVGVHAHGHLRAHRVV